MAKKEDARPDRADRSAVRQAIHGGGQDLRRREPRSTDPDVRDALYGSPPGAMAPRQNGAHWPAETAEAMQVFCMGADGEMFNREARPA
ncbi:hypothetical protein ACRFBT_24975 [Pseudomonas aeruginosa]|uniref:hypothetical protein n=1 Tax=Pseudomonas aeruginosa TaxID=287 RepID=UPI003D6DF8C9